MLTTSLINSPRTAPYNFVTSETRRPQTFARHDTISLKEGHVWRVEEGYLRTITMSENGDVRTLGIWGTGDIIGIPLNRNYPFQIECLTTTRASLIPDNTIFGGKWMVSHLQQTESLLTIQYQGLVKDRLLLFLQWLGDRFGQPTPDGTPIGILLTHQEISEAINSTRVTVTRTLNALEQAGYLGWSRRMCVLLPPSR